MRFYIFHMFLMYHSFKGFHMKIYRTSENQKVSYINLKIKVYICLMSMNLIFNQQVLI